MTEIEQKSALVKAIEARKRKTHLFKVSDFLGLPGPEIHHVLIRVASKGEENAAVCAAHAYVKSIAGNTDAKSDDDLLLDAKHCEILFRVCKDPEYPDGGAFLGPEWMREHFTTDHIAVLLNLYREVRKHEGPAPKEFDDATVEAVLKGCASVADEDAIPQAYLANCNREALSELVVQAAIKLDVARKEADTANSELKRLRES